MKIVVLLGGDSPEREISLKSGRAVVSTLKKKGYRVFPLDPSGKNFTRKILKIKPDCVFITLHGGKGEGGVIQGFLETLNIPYTGSDFFSSALCLNKIFTKKILKFHKIPTPDFMEISNIQYAISNIPFAFPVVVKPANLGSTIGITIVKKKNQLLPAIKKCFLYDREVFLEKYIDGKEITVSILGNEKPEVLPVIEIKTPTGFYDYKAKYTPGGSIHQIPPDLPVDIIEKAKEVSLSTYKVLKCRGFARMEIIVDKKGVPYVLDVNTIPGLTKMSLFPDSARAKGISFENLCEILIKLALKRWKKKQKKE